MDNNLFYSRGENSKSKKKIDFKQKKEKTLSSLNEVEHFLSSYKSFMKYVRLYKFFK